ncbi:hypothetical protein [Pseudobacteroides cellulosolvens]|uniref:Uncharacterized protein n=1 Tax=Pseudobacteroides cellulosolvens ATCC 35603 = DSM 2933 TaxID=398512 RepID=A0A0L6JT52_9FIRM|nr:hypothetical protein [Pseudobacteroides cellulosolvens]KNY28865.1 hypothetical protein Bccel_4139 [Pseudobacteroides cellulosolvens ATCC 35603 = DSM 2933]
MKKNYLIILLTFIILGVAGFSYLYIFSSKSITSFYNNDVSKISSIDILDGNNGNIISINDKKVIASISTFLSTIKLKRVIEKPSSGWKYRFSINEYDKEVLNIVFINDEYCKINSMKYKITKSSDVTIKSIYDEAVKSIKK